MNNPTRKLGIASVLSCAALLNGCIAEDSQFEYGPFTASYYFEDDGRDAGKGTDGTDPDVIATYIAQEEAPYPSINYVWSELLNIESYNFHAVWEGELEVFDPIKPINANFDVSWSDVSFFLDGDLIQKWSNSNRIIPLTLEKGVHQVRVEYHNHWHTTGFNVSFTNYPKLTVDTAKPEIGPLVLDDTKIVYISSYESDTLYNEVTVTLPEYGGSVMLFLSTYNSINWVINNPNKTKIAGVVLKSYGPGSTLLKGDGVSIYEVTDLSRNYDDFSQARTDIQAITGQSPDYTYGSYGLSEVIIPSFE